MKVYAQSILIMFFLMISLFSVSLDTLSATTTYSVSTTQQLEDAFVDAADGDTIIIDSGTYYPSFELDFYDRSLTVIGAGPDATIISGRDVGDSDDFLLGRDNLSDEEIDHMYISGLTVCDHDEEGIEGGACDDLIISNCVATRVDTGIYVTQMENVGASIEILECRSFDNFEDGYNLSTFIAEDISYSLRQCMAEADEEDGFDIELYGSEGIDFSMYACTATGNLGDKEDGIEIDIIESQDVSFSLDSCTATGNSDDGIDLSTEWNDEVHVTFLNCSANDNADDGINCEIHEDEDSSISFESCVANGNEEDGYEIFSDWADEFDISFLNCCANDNDDEGFDIYFSQGYVSATFDDCIANRNEGDGFDMGANGDDIDLMLNGCIGGENAEVGIDVYVSGGASGYIVNALCYGNECGIYVDNDGDGMLSVSNCTVYGNDAGIGVYNDGDAGQPINPTDILITNVASSGNDASFALEEDPYTPDWGDFPTVEHCLFDDLLLEASGYDILPLLGPGIFFEPPLFAQPLTHDFRPMAVSPLIDGGRDTSGADYGHVDDDIRDAARPQHGFYDIGAYEFVDVEPGLNPSSPATFKPLVTAALQRALSLWEDLLSQLPEELTEEQVAELERIEAHITGASHLGNPIAANGALQRAIDEMEMFIAAL